MARPLWRSNDHAFFHADPHAGNLLRTTDARPAVLDRSLSTTMDKDERIHLMQVLQGLE
ncbi:MAG: AarF/UbiB family protein [Thermodesulfobacteriota bacterium]